MAAWHTSALLPLRHPQLSTGSGGDSHPYLICEWQNRRGPIAAKSICLELCMAAGSQDPLPYLCPCEPSPSGGSAPHSHPTLSSITQGPTRSSSAQQLSAELFRTKHSSQCPFPPCHCVVPTEHSGSPVKQKRRVLAADISRKSSA